MGVDLVSGDAFLNVAGIDMPFGLISLYLTVLSLVKNVPVVGATRTEDDPVDVDESDGTVLPVRTACSSEVVETAVERTFPHLQSQSCSSTCSVWQGEVAEMLSTDCSARLSKHFAWCFGRAGH